MKDIIYIIYRTLFKGFIIEKDYKLLNKLKSDGINQLMIVKRSWVFGLLISWVLLVTIIIGIFNIIAIYNLANFTDIYIVLYGIIGILIYSIISLIINSILFLIHFKKTYGNLNVIKDIDIVITDIKRGDELFKKFFINVTINIFIFIITAIFYISIIYYLYIKGNIEGIKDDMFIVLNIILFLIQIILLNHYRRRMINFDMTYDIVIPGEMFFISQRGFISEVKTIEADIIRTIDGKYPNNFLFGLLDLGIIEIITIGGMEKLGTIDMTFINKPEETAVAIKDILLLKNKCKNNYLQKIINILNINCGNVDSEINRAKINKFLHENEEEEKKDFEKLDSVGKIELEEVFEKFYIK